MTERCANRRAHGDGGIDERQRHADGTSTWRLRYRLDGKRFTKTVRGTKAEAKRELRRLIRSGETGEHIAPDRITVAQWIDKWFALLERRPEGEQGRGRKRGLVNRRSIERYDELLRVHVVPTLGGWRLQKLGATEIDELYIELEKTLASRTVHQLHLILRACLEEAVKKKLILTNPAAAAAMPSPEETDVGIVLEEEELTRLVRGFQESAALYPIVAVAAFTGARRNEILALRWSDLSFKTKELTIERSLEDTKKYGRGVKEPKTKRGRRTIAIDDALADLLRSEHERHLRLAAGVPDGVQVDLSLVKLPVEALMFPGGDYTDPLKLRCPNAIGRNFSRRARKLGFGKLRFHDLRGTHETLLLDAGVPLHVVAKRCGHSPQVLLKNYAKRRKSTDEKAAAVIGTVSKTILGK
jgi:integrase